MALSQSHIDALEKALASGALSVDSPDVGRVTYRSVSELIAALAYAKGQVNAAPETQSFAAFAKD